MLCVSGWHTHYCLSLNCWNYRVIAWSKLGPSLANTCQVQIGNVCPQSQLDHPLSRNIEIKYFVFNDGNFFEIFVLTGRVNLFLLRSAGSRRHGAIWSCELSLVSSILFVCTLNLEMSWDVWRVERNAVRPVLGKVAMKEDWVQQYSSIHHYFNTQQVSTNIFPEKIAVRQFLGKVERAHSIQKACKGFLKLVPTTFKDAFLSKSHLWRPDWIILPITCYLTNDFMDKTNNTKC